MRLYSPVDLAGNVNMIEKLVLGRTGTGDLPIRAVDGPGFQRARPSWAGSGRAGPGRHSHYLQRAGPGRARPNVRTGRAGPRRNIQARHSFLLVLLPFLLV